jgi:hypothetical protein
MGFIKREEFDELRAELDALKKASSKKAPVKKSTSAKKKTAPQKKGK